MNSYYGFFVVSVISILVMILLHYLIRRKSDQVADGKRVCSKRENFVPWRETFYVEVATGKYYFAGDLIKEYGRQNLGKLVAEGKFVNEGHWEKMQEKKK